MPFIASGDGTRLYYEEAGTGSPVVFIHEFAGDYHTAAFNAALAELFAAAEAGCWLAHRPRA